MGAVSRRASALYSISTTLVETWILPKNAPMKARFFLASLDATTSCITSMAVSASRAGAIGQKKASYFDRRLLTSGMIRSPLAGGRGAAGRVPGVVTVI